MLIKNHLRFSFIRINWLAIIFLSLLLAHNAMLYFTHGGEYGILPEKIAARQELIWNAAFYLHLPSGIICLLLPIGLFQQWLIAPGSKIHRLAGKVYAWVTILIVCPTGLLLAVYAKGGVITQTGFALQAGLLGSFTWAAVNAIRKRNIQLHTDFMIRSYAVAAVVLSFRIYHIIFVFLHVPYVDNYAISQWLGLSGNALLAEVIILVRNRKPFTFPLSLKHYKL